jgi:hypothetical protein
MVVPLKRQTSAAATAKRAAHDAPAKDVLRIRFQWVALQPEVKVKSATGALVHRAYQLVARNPNNPKQPNVFASVYRVNRGSGDSFAYREEATPEARAALDRVSLCIVDGAQGAHESEIECMLDCSAKLII